MFISDTDAALQNCVSEGCPFPFRFCACFLTLLQTWFCLSDSRTLFWQHTGANICSRLSRWHLLLCACALLFCVFELGTCCPSEKQTKWLCWGHLIVKIYILKRRRLEQSMCADMSRLEEHWCDLPRKGNTGVFITPTVSFANLEKQLLKEHTVHVSWDALEVAPRFW